MVLYLCIVASLRLSEGRCAGSLVRQDDEWRQCEWGRRWHGVVRPGGTGRSVSQPAMHVGVGYSSWRRPLDDDDDDGGSAVWNREVIDVRTPA